MNAETIKDFLISLGFDVDEKGGRKFEAVVTGVTLNVIKMGVAVEAAALTVVGFTTKIASGLDKLYWQSQRTGATANNIRAIGYAFSQTGGSIEGFNGTLDNLARFLRNTPGGEGFLRNLGIQTRDANGNLRDTAELVTLVGDKLAKMPYYRANQYAQILGIDEATLLAMRRGVSGFTADYQSMLQATGFDSQKAAEQSNKFMTQMTGLTSLFGIMRDKIGANLAGGLAGNLENFRKNILLNFPKIEGVITAVLKKVLSLADSIMTLVYRGIQGFGSLMKWWDGLDDKTKLLIKSFGGLLVAWRILNSAFIKSPIGMLTALVVALLLLYDDYLGWKEGADSLIDWSKWQPDVEKAIAAIKDIISFLDKGAKAVGGWDVVLKGLMVYMGGKWLLGMMTPIGKVVNALMGFPKLFTAALSAAGLYAVVATINETYERTKALINGEKYDQIPTQTEEMNERDRLSKENWQKNNPGVPYVNPGVGGLNWLPGKEPTFADPRGIRNNNPGNLNFVGQNGAQLESHATPRFAKFQTAFDGFSALGKQIKAYYNGTSKAVGYQKLQSVEDIISRFAPPKENNTQAYINKLSKTLGVGRGETLNIHDPQVLATLMNGITQIENGKNPYAPEMVLKAAQSTVGLGAHQASSGNPVFNINVDGAGDPRETARLTGNAVEGVYRRQTRNLQSQVG